MLDSLRYDEHLASANIHRAVPEIDPKVTVQDDKGLVSILVIVPHEITFNLYDLELIVVHFRDDFRRPLLRKQGELFIKVYRFVCQQKLPFNVFRIYAFNLAFFCGGQIGSSIVVSDDEQSKLQTSRARWQDISY